MRLLLTSLTLLTAASLTSCGGSNENAKPAEPKTMTVTGGLQLMDGSGIEELYENDDVFDDYTGECLGTGGYADINEGAQVTVYDASGEALALGTLQSGTWDVESEELAPCTFPFTVEEVPADGNVFSVEVSGRGKVNFEKGDAGSLLLTLGE